MEGDIPASTLFGFPFIRVGGGITFTTHRCIVEVIILGLAPRSDARAAHVWCPTIALVHVLEGALAEGARSTEVCCCPWSVLDSRPNRGSEPGPTESPGSSDPRGPVCLPVPGSCGGGRAYYMPCTIQVTNIQHSQPVPRLFNNT